MGSAASLSAALKEATEADLAAAVRNLSDEDRARLSAALASTSPLATPEDVVSYWFSGSTEEKMVRHWKGLKETDDEIKDKFGPTWEALSDTGDKALADQWAAGGPKSVLALIIVWDQFSRALNRGSGRAFSNDNRAGKLAMETVKSGIADDAYSKEEFAFVKMPLLHAEDLEVHKWNVSQPGGDTEHAVGHLRVMERFGRFPKRNAALGRESTPEEIEYMNSPEAQNRPY